jgi:uncharacterized protein DUF6636
MNQYLRVSAAVAALCISVVGGGCGAATTTVTVTQSTSPSLSAARTQAESPAHVPVKPIIRGEAPPQVVHVGSFRSPSGNIGCMIIDRVARCDIVKRNWTPPPRPSDCPNVVDYGQGIELSGLGQAKFVCAGDTARDPTSKILSYGTASQVGDFSCHSAMTGVTCTNRKSHHGFELSVQSYRIF